MLRVRFIPGTPRLGSGTRFRFGAEKLAHILRHSSALSYLDLISFQAVSPGGLLDFSRFPGFGVASDIRVMVLGLQIS